MYVLVTYDTATTGKPTIEMGDTVEDMLKLVYRAGVNDYDIILLEYSHSEQEGDRRRIVFDSNV